MLTLNLIPQEHSEMVWPLAERHIERSLERAGTITLESHKAHVLAGLRQLWLIWDDEHEDKCRAAIVTEIKGDLCFIWALGGEGMSDWLHLHHDLERWARSQGCSGMQLWGRPGWLRALDEYGYTKKKLVVMHKEFKP